MRILLVHNFYGSTAPSGENKVFEAEKAMLEKHGETVDVFTRHSDEIRGKGPMGLLKGALCTIGNPFAARALKKKIRAFKPDVVHFHNQFPLISPLALRAAHKCGVKVVMTLHNYRTVCAAGIPMRGNRVCDACFRKVKVNGEGERRKLSVLPAIKCRCYRGSLVATLPLAVNIWLYRHCWAKWVDTFIVLSEFQKKIMVECGFPAEKIVVKGNFIQEGAKVEVGGGQRKTQVVFVGRLSDEKGVETLVEARKELEKQSEVGAWRLIIVGDGDRRAAYEKLAEGLNIEFLGQKGHEEVLRLIAESRCVVQPSVCWETFGMVVAEGMSVGVPAVVSDIGALPDLVQGDECGEIFEAGNVDALAAAIVRLLSRADYDAVCEACKKRVHERYSEESNYRDLKKVYADA